MPRCYHRSALEAEGFSARTIRWYTERGILPHAIGRGKAAYYTDQHIAILREIKRRRDAASSLPDIRDWRMHRFKAC